MFDKSFSMVSKCVDDPRKGLVDMSKIRDRSRDDDVLSFFTVRKHARDECIGICTGVFSIGIPACFPVIADFVHISEVRERVGDDDRCSAPAREEPDATLGIQDAEFEARSRLTVETVNVFFGIGFLCSKGIRECEIAPEGFFSVCFGRIESCHHVETMDMSCMIENERIHFEIDESCMNEKIVECREKLSDFLIIGHLADFRLENVLRIVRERDSYFRDGFPIFFDLHASRFGEIENIVIAFRPHGDVVFGIVRNERFHEKSMEFSALRSNHDFLIVSLLPPGENLGRREIHSDESVFPAFSEELIGFDDEFSRCRLGKILRIAGSFDERAVVWSVCILGIETLCVVFANCRLCHNFLSVL